VRGSRAEAGGVPPASAGSECGATHDGGLSNSDAARRQGAAHLSRSVFHSVALSIFWQSGAARGLRGGGQSGWEGV